MRSAVLESVRCPTPEPIIFSRTTAFVSFPWAHVKGNELLSFLFLVYTSVRNQDRSPFP